MITCIAQGVSLGFIVSSSAFVPPIVLGCLRVLETSEIWPTGQTNCLHVRALHTQIFTTGGLSFRIDAILTFFMCCRKRNMWMQREDQFCFSSQSIVSQNVSKLFYTLALGWLISDSQNYHFAYLKLFSPGPGWPWVRPCRNPPLPPGWRPQTSDKKMSSTRYWTSRGNWTCGLFN